MSATLAATIQSAIQFGMAQAANVLGSGYTQYRANGVNNPTGGGCYIGTLPAIFTADPKGQVIVPVALGKNAWWAILPTAQTQVGDYLVGTPGAQAPGDLDTWFITSQFPDQALAGCIKCTNVFSVLRPPGNANIGAQPYGGDIPGAETPILTGWPGGLLQGTKGEKGDSVLPGDVRMPWYYIFLPAYANPATNAVVLIEAADVITDDFGRRYKVSSCELTTAGWRLTAILAQT